MLISTEGCLEESPVEFVREFEIEPNVEVGM